MRQKYIFLILGFCAITLGGVFLKVARVANGYVPGGSDREEFIRVMSQFVHPAPKDESPYYLSGGIVHPTPQSTLSNDESLIKAKVADCKSYWPVLPPIVGKSMQPMVIRNARHTSITLQVDGDKNKTQHWSVAPGATWKTFTNVGRRWLVTDNKRCLFYVTAGDEPLRMVVNTQT